MYNMYHYKIKYTQYGSRHSETEIDSKNIIIIVKCTNGRNENHLCAWESNCSLCLYLLVISSILAVIFNNNKRKHKINIVRQFPAKLFECID